MVQEKIKYYKVDNYTFKNFKKAEQFQYLITNYNFDRSQKEVITAGLNEDLDVRYYAKPEYNWAQMEQIRFGLKEGLNVSIYANKKYNGEEMKEILFSLLNSNFKIKTSTKIKMFIQKIKGN